MPDRVFPPPPVDGAVRIARRYRREMRHYWRDCRSPRDFRSLMQARLSLSKAGKLACPRPIHVRVATESLGPGVVLRSHSTDVSVFKELTLSGSYDMVDEHVQGPLGTIVDLGANTGLAARWLHRRHPQARLVCVEPEPGNLAVLRRNLAGVEGATVVAACVGAWERRVQLDSRTGDWGYRMRDGGGDIPVVTMPAIVREHGLESIDLLKCDIEGAERELFASCRDWIGRVQLGVVECHDGMSADDLMALLEANGARVEVVHVLPNPPYRTEVVTFRRLPAGGA